MSFREYLPVLFIAAFCLAPLAAPSLPADMHAMALSSIDLVYREDFKQSQSAARKIIREYPHHPAGYFFLAAVLDARMEQLQSNDDELEFYKYCDIAVSKGEELLQKNPGDQWARFFMGGANGSRGTYESRYNRWITAFRFGWQGVTAFKEISSSAPEIKDGLMGIATYDYWRSAMTKTMWWMPGVQDRRPDAIAALYDVMKSGVYVKEAAAKQLIPILNNEKRYTEALTVADGIITKYPTYLPFLWGKAEALTGLGKYREAEQTINYILMRVESQHVSNGYNEILCRYYLARVYLLTNRYSLCVDECKKVMDYPADADTKKRLESQMADAAAIRKKAGAMAK